MRLFKTSHGFVFSFGFNMVLRLPDPHIIQWCDPTTNDWDPKLTNQAGSIMLPTVHVDPQFVREVSPSIIVAYQPGLCMELVSVGQPIIWACHCMRPDQTSWFDRAA